MAFGSVNGLVHAATCPANADNVTRDSRLRFEIFEGDVDIAGQLVQELRFPLDAFHVFYGRALALAVAAVVEGQDMNAGGSQLLGKPFPGFALLIALVEEKHTGSRLVGAEVG